MDGSLTTSEPAAAGAALLVVGVLAGILSAARAAPAQATWSKPPALEHRLGHAMAYDSSRGCIVLFGGTPGHPSSPLLADTWEHDGQGWTHREPRERPSPRLDHAMAYDAARGRVVLFGGSDASGPLDDTWEYDGGSWYQCQPSQRPPPMARHQLVFDEARARVLLVGGVNTPATWEWDGVDWRQRSPSREPPLRREVALGYDPVRARVVLFGGIGGHTTFLDTWEWDGFDWTEVAPPQAPPGHGGAMAWDPARGQLLFLHTGASAIESWAWDGTTWTRLTPSTTPPLRFDTALATDLRRGRVVLFGGKGFGSMLADTWEWDGADWALTIPEPLPAPRHSHALAFDEAAGCTILFGGHSQAATWSYHDDTWTWDGAAWHRHEPPIAPSARRLHAMAYDPRRQRTVLFGGEDLSAYPPALTTLGDTWEWDGAAWTRMTPPAAPPARQQHAMAFDAIRGQVILFGGTAGSTAFADTWAWDGIAWTQLSLASGPSLRYAHAMARDADRERVVLFGGAGPSTSAYPELGDTWELDALGWRQVATAGPPPRYFHALAYDAARRRTVLFGGRARAALGDVWEWDGSSWEARGTVEPEFTRYFHAMAFDHRREQVVLFGGWPAAADLRLWAPQHRAVYLPFGDGCAGTAGTPRLDADGGGRPWLGDRFVVCATQLPRGQPAVLHHGLSRSSWQGLPLPADLGAVGMTGCTLWASGELTLPATVDAAGEARWTLPVPPRAALLGAEFFDQCFVLDPGANGLGVGASNGAAGRIGGR